MKTFKWTERQKKALRGSIGKWVKIVNGTGEDEGAANCPCCQIWLGDDESCEGCPIKKFTGQPRCHDTPYISYTVSYTDSGDLKERARAELNFLRAVYLAGGGK